MCNSTKRICRATTGIRISTTQVGIKAILNKKYQWYGLETLGKYQYKRLDSRSELYSFGLRRSAFVFNAMVVCSSVTYPVRSHATPIRICAKMRSFSRARRTEKKKLRSEPVLPFSRNQPASC